jgi:hypothetical protein
MKGFANPLIRNKRSIYFLLLLLAGTVLSFSSCKKYEEEIIPGNQAPPDQTIDPVVIENYVHKVYISALGREPDSVELNSGLSLLTSQNLSMNSRNQFLDNVFSNQEFNDKFCERARIELLQGLDTAEITQRIFLYQLLLLDSSYILFWDDIQVEINRLIEMKEVPDSLSAGVINFKEVQRRYVDNSFYDDLNMGSFNFVVSVFQHFLDRYPTQNEIDAGVTMVNGLSAVIFLTAGQSKHDFENIFFGSTDFYEGEVRGLYQQYLFRTPTSVEMTNGTLLYMQNDDYIALQKSILSKNEFIGI